MEDSDRISTTAHTSGIFSSRSSYADLDASILDDDVIPARTTTPLLARVPDEPWYMRLLSEWCDAWENVRDLWQTRDCWSRLNAMICFVLLPVRVIRKAASPHNHVIIPDHTSICYLFLLMCYTFVINLVDLNTDEIHEKRGSRERRDVFMSSCMVLAIAAMLYIYLSTKDRVRHDPCHDAPIRIFFRGGLYLFGFLSILNSFFLAYEEGECPSSKKDFNYPSAVTVQIVKALFVVGETLFLGYFHKARFPLNAMFLQISLAHLLGTNLALWFWTFCEETKLSSNSYCKKPELDWSSYQKYFYPVFVEYLILALAILYGLWKNLRQGEETCCRFCKNCSRCLIRSQTFAHEQENNERPHSFRQRYIPRCSFGMTFGTIYVAIFLLVIVLAIQRAEKHEYFRQTNMTNQTNITHMRPVKINLDSTGQFKAYCGWSIVMYLSMISACYIILASIRSPNNLRQIRSIDYDDFLLYISLMGILLLEGFHVISKILTKRASFHLVAVDISGTIQHLTQVVTLMSLSHCRGATSPRNRIWVCECILFLFLTNLAWWIEDSFYLESKLTRPGEIETIKGIETYGTIVKPMVIFFRFHSATYFFNAWTIYKA